MSSETQGNQTFFCWRDIPGFWPGYPRTHLPSARADALCGGSSDLCAAYASKPFGKDTCYQGRKYGSFFLIQVPEKFEKKMLVFNFRSLVR